MRVACGRMTKRNKMPASIPAATLVGMRSIRRSNGAMADATKVSAAATMKAPTAAGISRLAPDAAISAAPGVDQAVIRGNLWCTLRIAAAAAIARQMQVIHDAVSAGVARSASAAANTMAIEPAQPTIAAVTAATTGANNMRI